MAGAMGKVLRARDAQTDAFLKALSDPFAAQLGQEAAASSLVFSLVAALLMAGLFCFLRPYNNVVYAPRAKYADSKHAPPPVNPGILGWVPPLLHTKEQDLVDRVGLDAALFMRVCRMFRNIFTILAVIGCGIVIPVNLIGGRKASHGQPFFAKMEPTYLYIQPSATWAFVIVAYLFTAVILFFLWINYRQVTKLRRDYFNSQDYQRSLHARTLLVTDIPSELRSDEGIARLTDEVKATHDMPRTVIARNVKDLPELVEEHETTVRELEEVLSKYLKNPDRLPATRPMCKPHKSDKSYGTYPKGQKVDAIEYLTARVKELELEIREVRQSVDKRNPLPYGFASYENIPVAHGVAYAARKKRPQGAIVQLAPKPHDLVWKNLKMLKKERSRANFINGIWITLLTALWVVPNILIAVFLSNLNNLGQVWPAFQKNLEAHRTSWSIVQGVVAPAITTAFYFFLPSIFRRLCMKAGDISKTSRERHVARNLYTFFCFNNLIVFSLFSAAWTWIASLIHGTDFIKSAPLTQMLNGLCGVSPYWISWMLQRNLGAAVDLSQLWMLIWGSFSRRFLSPTPRRLIELSAPQPMDYAGYYNYFLFYATVAVTFATIQPLILVVTAIYFWLDSFMKKYLILYVFITKYESGGMFWRSVYNRVVFLTLLGNVVIALVIAATGGHILAYWPKLAAMVPLLVVIVSFKVYCRRTFDDDIHYYQKGQGVSDDELVVGVEAKKKRKGDRVAVRFGHPVLYVPLITPMVASKSQHLLKQIYTGRTSTDADTSTVAGYTDVYMDNMDSGRPGKPQAGVAGPPGWEIVNESEMDFEHYKDRPEFRDEAGGDGELYGRATDFVRPGTPSSMNTFSRAGTFSSQYSQEPYDRSRSGSRDSSRTRAGEGVDYPRGYHQTASNLREASPAGSDRGYNRPSRLGRQDSRDGLVDTAAPVGHGPPGGYAPVNYGDLRAGTPEYGSGEEDTSYDYFRRGRRQDPGAQFGGSLGMS